MTDIEFAEGVALLTASIGKPMAKDMAKAWFAILEDLTAEQFRRGIVETMRTHQFAGFPPVGVIRKLALGGIQCETLEVTDRALLAWNAVVDAIREIGGYRSPQFDDPLIHATIRAICQGWPELCATESTQLHAWTKKAFLETYRAQMAGRTVTESAAAALPGILAADARLHGYEDPGAVAIATRLPAPPVKLLPSAQPMRIEAADSVGRALSVPKFEKPEEPPKAIVIINVPEKRKEAIAKLYREMPEADSQLTTK